MNGAFGCRHFRNRSAARGTFSQSQRRLLVRRRSSNPQPTASVVTRHAWRQVELAQRRFEVLVKQWEDFSGLSQVSTAHRKVKETQEALSNQREEVLQFKTTLRETEESLSVMRAQLERVPHEDMRYPELARGTHQLLRKQRKELDVLKSAEERERWIFDSFKDRVDELRQAEKAYTERTKYWSMIASLVGALIGFVGSSFIWFQRRRQWNSLVEQVKTNSSSEKVVQLLAEPVKTVSDAAQELRCSVESLRALRSSLSNTVTAVQSTAHVERNTVVLSEPLQKCSDAMEDCHRAVLDCRNAVGECRTVVRDCHRTFQECLALMEEVNTQKQSLGVAYPVFRTVFKMPSFTLPSSSGDSSDHSTTFWLGCVGMSLLTLMTLRFVYSFM